MSRLLLFNICTRSECVKLQHTPAPEAVACCGRAADALVLPLLLCASLYVQGVTTQLTRDAYETHARIALEAADLAEFRQCLARLKQLYRAGVRPRLWCCSLVAAVLRIASVALFGRLIMLAW